MEFYAFNALAYSMFLFGLTPIHRHSQERGQRGYGPPKFLKIIVILFFQSRFSRQNNVICLKSNILPPSNFWAGYATATISNYLYPQYFCTFIS